MHFRVLQLNDASNIKFL